MAYVDCGHAGTQLPPLAPENNPDFRKVGIRCKTIVWEWAALWAEGIPEDCPSNPHSPLSEHSPFKMGNIISKIINQYGQPNQESPGREGGGSNGGGMAAYGRPQQIGDDSPDTCEEAPRAPDL